MNGCLMIYHSHTIIVQFPGDCLLRRKMAPVTYTAVCDTWMTNIDYISHSHVTRSCACYTISSFVYTKSNFSCNLNPLYVVCLKTRENIFVIFYHFP